MAWASNIDTAVRRDVNAVLVEQVLFMVKKTLRTVLWIVLLDWLLTTVGSHVSSPLIDPFSDSRRAAYIVALLTLVGLPSVLLATLTSLAMTTLSPYASPSVVLLHIRYPVTRGERAWAWFAGPGNLFRWSLQVSLYVSASLFALFALGAVGLSGGFTLTLIAITVMAIIDLLLLLSYVFWIISLRPPSRVIEYMLASALNALQQVSELGVDHRYLPLPQNFVRGRYRPRYLEQDRVLRLAQALTQSTLRALQDRQPIPAIEGVEALGLLYERGAQPRPNLEDLWYDLPFRDNEEARMNWLRVVLLEGLRDVLVASAEAHYVSVGEAVLPKLDELGRSLLAEGDRNNPTHRELFRTLIETYVNAFDETVQFNEPALQAQLLLKVATRIGQLRELRDTGGDARVAEWIAALRFELPTIFAGTGTPSIARDELGALRAVTDLMRSAAAAFPEMRADIATGALHLGASALALRADRSASLLAGWIAGQFDRTGADTALAGQVILRTERAVGLPRFMPAIAGSTDLAATAPSQPPEPGARPAFVTTDYVEVFLVLVAARAVQFRGSDTSPKSTATWTDGALSTVREAVINLTQGRKRCEWVCDRVCNASQLGQEERVGWVAAVARVWAG